MNNDSGVIVANFATSKNLIVKSTKFLHHNIHKSTCTSNANTIKFTIYVGDGIQIYFKFDHSGGQTMILTIIWWLEIYGKTGIE
jgi:hypothetical protein